MSVHELTLTELDQFMHDAAVDPLVDVRADERGVTVCGVVERGAPSGRRVFGYWFDLLLAGGSIVSVQDPARIGRATISDVWLGEGADELTIVWHTGATAVIGGAVGPAVASVSVEPVARRRCNWGGKLRYLPGWEHLAD
jgi:hypothetical protein